MAIAPARPRAIPWTVLAPAFLLLAALAAGGWWAHFQVRSSLQDLRFGGLAALLEAKVGTMRLWIEEKKRDAERWASTPAVQRAAVKLVGAAAQGQPAAAICASAARRELLQEIAPYVVLEETVAFNLTLRDGTIIASNHDVYCGAVVASPEFLAAVAPVFEGRTVFVRPFAERDRVPGVATPPIDRPLVWVATPVRGPSGEVIASLGFGRLAEQRFGRLLRLTTSRTSREAYAFDRRGLMLTETRYLDEVRAAGALGAGDTPILAMPVGETPLVLSALSEGGDGAVRDPYTNYRGVEVIGVWRWLADEQMAVAVEVESEEAFAPLQYVQIALGGMVGILLLAIAAAGVSSVWAVKLRLREARRLGPYEIEREIGEGGMSHVYLAHHSLLKRPTALKVLRTAIASDEVVTRFEREVRLCSQLTHPNTIEIYDYGRSRDGKLYYAMEYLHGISIEDLVRRDGPMPLARVVHSLLQVCGSLREAHERGLVHRDVKPHNLMLCVRGGRHDVVKVLDFGLVKELRNPHTRDLTQYAKVLGTPLYMAPERLRDPADADARADIYALGAVAWFMLTGKPVFAAETDHDLVYRILNSPAPTLAEGGATVVPPQMETLIARCLAKDRGERPADIEAVELVLAQLAIAHPWSEADARAWWLARASALGIDLPA